MNHPPHQAPVLRISAWLNTDRAITLADLRGQVVVLHAFQMLCPGCVSHGLPQALAIRNTFSQDNEAVLGIHTVFEHHAVMGPEALSVFLQECDTETVRQIQGIAPTCRDNNACSS